MVTIELGSTEDADAAADCWVELAADQRELGSHLLADENHTTIREAFTQSAVADELVVARDDADELVGFVTFGIESNSYEQDATRGLVQNIYVVPDRRDEGIGSDLLRAAEERLVESGADTLALEMMAANDDARRFYRRHGYAPHRIELEKSVESDTLTKE
ncbi:GNAT family N-acetyltransferase [Halorussus salinisoli]|uniref:GNAT family N-acetyltransferase n=1 Tax=Halorussus salinisoli TaxID=2558242 RepID=UPI0010C16EB6|nr:GNAT family N-acetyltransferase [Halorussus salinisoli]